MKTLRAILCLIQLSISSGYIQLSSLKSKIFHKVLINDKIKTDFKKISSNDAYQLACFWHSELVDTISEKINEPQNSYDQNINLLYTPKHIFDNSVNLTDFKYNIINDNSKNNQYYIWRPKVQICLPSLYGINEYNGDEDVCKIKINEDNNDEEICKPLLYPSFRETMYLLSIDTKNRKNGATINNIVKSPYWNEPKHESYKTLQFSVNNYFVNYLKYNNLKYK